MGLTYRTYCILAGRIFELGRVGVLLKLQQLAIAESQLRDYRTRLGMPFPHEAYLSQLTTIRDRLKAGLSGTDTEHVPALAEQIAALKAAHTIDAAPERIGKRRALAAEPVTTVIRRRIEALLVSDVSRAADSAARGHESSGATERTP